jgi:hypothetical protein
MIMPPDVEIVVDETPETVVEPAPGGGDTGTAFAAGVASATAEQSAELADAAAIGAAAAGALAEEAGEIAMATAAEVEALRLEIAAQGETLAEIASMLSAREGDELVPEEIPPAAVAIEVDEQPEPEGEKDNRTRRFGSDTWFGDRR